jgi:hypothetical protein
MKRIIVLGLMCLSISFVGLSQADTYFDSHQVTVTIPNVALLDLETSAPSKNFTLNFNAPTEAGLKIVNPLSNATVWLNYSSIVSGPSGAHPVRKVTVQSNVNPPAGIAFSATASADAGAGGGTVGSTLGNVSIDNTVQDIIENIYSCYTGTGPLKGHQLTYNANVPTGSLAYAQLRAGSTAMTITYTLTDQ